MGRKKLGNVLFAKRVSPDKIPLLLKALEADRVSVPTPEPQSVLNAKETASMVAPGQIQALLDDIEKVSGERDDLKRQLDCFAAGDNEALAILLAENKKMKVRVTELENLMSGG